ncbi:MAG: hypothetical protein IPM06_20990, partial [Rhizobiales bacterium]|nr:hypothetical protein [Hyphomicrobiales bacterium]
MKALRAADAAGDAAGAARLAQMAVEARKAVPGNAAAPSRAPQEAPIPAMPAESTSPAALTDPFVSAMAPNGPEAGTQIPLGQRVPGLNVPAAPIGTTMAPSIASGPSDPLVAAMQATAAPPAPRVSGPVINADQSRGPVFEQSGRANPGSLMDQAVVAAMRNEAAKPKSTFTPTPQEYTPTGEAILSSLGNVPERIGRGFVGNALQAAESGILSGLVDIGRAKDVASNPQSALDEVKNRRLALAKQFEMSNDINERNAILAEMRSAKTEED